MASCAPRRKRYFVQRLLPQLLLGTLATAQPYGRIMPPKTVAPLPRDRPRLPAGSYDVCHEGFIEKCGVYITDGVGKYPNNQHCGRRVSAPHTDDTITLSFTTFLPGRRVSVVVWGRGGATAFGDGAPPWYKQCRACGCATIHLGAQCAWSRVGGLSLLRVAPAQIRL